MSEETKSVVATEESNSKKDNRRPRRNNRRPKQQVKKEFEERVVNINRVTKVVKGGRIFRFAAIVVVGDRKGRVGVGTGKAGEVPDAIKKAIEDAKRNMISVPIVGSTIPHDFVGRFGAGSVIVKPAAPGTGVIAGGPVRAVIELAGYEDILSKSLGSRTPINMVRATINALQNMRTVEQVAEIRGLKVEDIL